MQILAPSPTAAKKPEVPFGVNEMRLSARQWAVTCAIVVGLALLIPPIWSWLERFETGVDYRIPYQLSKDYWLYDRRLSQENAPKNIFVLGDSVVWGEYVTPNGTLSHFLNQDSGLSNQFINAGVNGLFPLAMEGLIKYHASSLRGRKVLLHWNPLWMTSPKADLSTEKEETFNHAALVPQYYPRIRCYRADANDRLSAVIGRHVTFFSWVNHLQNTYFGQKSMLQWTLETDGGQPPKYLNARKNPLAQISMRVPSSPSQDPDRGPNSQRHKAWSTTGTGDTKFEWVELDASVQWQAFQRVVALLRTRGNQVLVLMGPFNEHMMAQDNRQTYRRLRDAAKTWLSQNQIACVAPDALPSALYADASHPLTEGYALLAKRIAEDASFQQWLRR